jgi:hypothetical protein
LTERFGRSVVTDAAGRFRLPKLPAGARLSLTVQHPDFVAYRSDKTQSAYPVSIGENSIDIELKPAVTIRGRLLADGKPIEQADVQVSAVDRSRGKLAARTKTDDQGRFELTGLDENEYLLQTSAFTKQGKGLIGTPIAVEQRAAGSSGSVDLDCTPGQVVTGTITDNQGRPAAGFGVLVRDIERLKDPKAEMIAAADAEGRYLLRLAPGAYALSARDWNRGKPRNDVHGVKILESGPIVALDFRISIVPEKLTGKLVDDHGHPLAGIIYSRSSPVATSGQDGVFTVREYGPVKSECCAVNRDKTLFRMFVWSGLKDDFPEQIVLSPAAKVVGRLIGEGVDGLSREDLNVACAIPVDRPSRGLSIHGLNRALWQLKLQADGQFEFTLPVGFDFLFYGSQASRKFRGTLFKADDLQPGELRDVGEVQYP